MGTQEKAQKIQCAEQLLPLFFFASAAFFVFIRARQKMVVN